MIRFFLLISIAFAACTSSRNALEAPPAALRVDASSVQITRQDVYPGAQGPVRMIRNYRVQLMASASTPIQPVFLLVDSVRLPIRRMSVMGEQKKDLSERIQGEGMELVLQFTQQFPSKQKPTGFGMGALISDAMTAEKSGEMLEGMAKLEYLSGEEKQVVVLGEVTPLEDLYAP